MALRRQQIQHRRLPLGHRLNDQRPTHRARTTCFEHITKSHIAQRVQHCQQHRLDQMRSLGHSENANAPYTRPHRCIPELPHPLYLTTRKYPYDLVSQNPADKLSEKEISTPAPPKTNPTIMPTSFTNICMNPESYHDSNLTPENSPSSSSTKYPR